MTKEEYRKELQDQKNMFTKKKMELDRKYVFSNNNVKIGDIVEDHIGSVLVDVITFGFGYGGDIPECIYKGKELRKDLKPRKDKAVRSVYQSNLT